MGCADEQSIYYLMSMITRLLLEYYTPQDTMQSTYVYAKNITWGQKLQADYQQHPEPTKRQPQPQPP
jgi:hypothetical protein